MAQFELENIAWAEGYSPHVELLTFEEMPKKLFVANENGKLHLYLNGGNDQRRKVAIAHFHDGFMPEHFKTPEEWQIREQMELSTAIMSPSVYLHLLGSKTVQRELAKEGAVEKYFADQPEKAELVRKLRGTFIEMWALGENDEAIVEQAIRHPNGFVLKANTDGGKGNFFDDKMAKMLKELRMNSEERSKYILQKRINPFRIKAI